MILTINMIYLATWTMVATLWHNESHFLQLSSCQSFMFFPVNLTEGEAVKFLKLNSHILYLLSEEIIKGTDFMDL